MFGKVKKSELNVINQKNENHQQSHASKKWDKLNEKLKGSKFRLLNEYFYTVDSAQAEKHFQQNPQEFQIYHEGYSAQIQKWPESPAQNIIKLLEKSPEFIDKNLVICDLGCGEGQIQEHFIQKSAKNIKKMFSYDLVSVKNHIQVADIKNLPLKSESCDIAIFSLSLMGINYLEYLGEGFRILKLNGYFIIAEVKSRMKSIDSFVNLIAGMGCRILKRDEHNTHFVLLVFQKVKEVCQFNGTLNQKRVLSILGYKDTSIKEWDQLGQHILQPCLYKKR